LVVYTTDVESVLTSPKSCGRVSDCVDGFWFADVLPLPLTVTVGRAEPLVAAAEEVALASTFAGEGVALTTEAARPMTPAINAVPFIVSIMIILVKLSKGNA